MNSEREREREASKEDAFDSKKRRLDFERRRRRDPPPPPITHALCRTHIHTHTHIPKEERITHHKSFRRLCEEKIECIESQKERIWSRDLTTLEYVFLLGFDDDFDEQ